MRVCGKLPTSTRNNIHRSIVGMQVQLDGRSELGITIPVDNGFGIHRCWNRHSSSNKGLKQVTETQAATGIVQSPTQRCHEVDDNDDNSDEIIKLVAEIMSMTELNYCHNKGQ